MNDEVQSAVLKEIIDKWRNQLGINQATLADILGKDYAQLSKNLKNPPKDPSILISKLASAISSVTEHADEGNNLKLSIPVVDRNDGLMVKVRTSYTGSAISTVNVLKSLKGEVSVENLTSQPDPLSPDQSFAWSQFLSIPQREWKSGTSTPSSLLITMYAVVPFHGREREMGDLESWADKDAVLGVRLYTGFGGMGKTRLAMETCSRLQEQDFTCGFLDYELAVATEVKEAMSARIMDLIFDRILLREQKFWCDQISARRLEPALYSGFDFLMGVISAIGGVEYREDAITLIKSIKLFQGQKQATIEAIADLLHGNYPGRMWVEPIAPDLLMERLVVKAMKEDEVAFLAFFK